MPSCVVLPARIRAIVEVMFRVVSDEHATDATFHLPIAAISSALTMSMGKACEIRVFANTTLVCIARGGSLFTEDGVELSPSAAARAAMRCARGSTPSS